jgi:hypothetical protein
MKLLPTDRITGWDPVNGESAPCIYCFEKSVRVVTVTSAAGAVRRYFFCPNHFVEAVIQFPLLRYLERRHA